MNYLIQRKNLLILQILDLDSKIKILKKKDYTMINLNKIILK